MHKIYGKRPERIGNPAVRMDLGRVLKARTQIRFIR